MSAPAVVPTHLHARPEPLTEARRQLSAAQEQISLREAATCLAVKRVAEAHHQRGIHP